MTKEYTDHILSFDWSTLQDLERGDEDKDAEVKINPQSVIKPLHKIVAEHKDVVKIAIQLNSIVATIKPEVSTLLKEYAIYDELWAEVLSYRQLSIANLLFNKCVWVYCMKSLYRTFVTFPILNRRSK